MQFFGQVFTEKIYYNIEYQYDGFYSKLVELA